MSHQSKTNVTRLKIRKAMKYTEEPAPPQSSLSEWREDEATPARNTFLHNLSVAGALVLCVVTLRTGALPSLEGVADAVLTAATDQSLLDEQLGKLSFVSALFPEAVLVFGEQHSADAVIPVDVGIVTHAWSQTEPYISWQTQSLQVISAVPGEVTGILHGYGDEKIVEISDDAAYQWLYGNLDHVSVSLGDRINTGDQIGTMLPGEDFVLEVRRFGHSINPDLLLK